MKKLGQEFWEMILSDPIYFGSIIAAIVVLLLMFVWLLRRPSAKQLLIAKIVEKDQQLKFYRCVHSQMQPWANDNNFIVICLEHEIAFELRKENSHQTILISWPNHVSIQVDHDKPAIIIDCPIIGATNKSELSFPQKLWYNLPGIKEPENNTEQQYLLTKKIEEVLSSNDFSGMTDKKLDTSDEDLVTVVNTTEVDSNLTESEKNSDNVQPIIADEQHEKEASNS